MRKTIKTITLLFLLTTISCEDFFEEDITDEFPVLFTPLDEAAVTTDIVRFEWDTLSGANKYRIQLFDVEKAVILDSVIVSPFLNYKLPKGKYQWRVRGENFGYKSAYSLTFDFINNL